MLGHERIVAHRHGRPPARPPRVRVRACKAPSGNAGTRGPTSLSASEGEGAALTTMPIGAFTTVIHRRGDDSTSGPVVMRVLVGCRSFVGARIRRVSSLVVGLARLQRRVRPRPGDPRSSSVAEASQPLPVRDVPRRTDRPEEIERLRELFVRFGAPALGQQCLRREEPRVRLVGPRPDLGENVCRPHEVPAADRPRRLEPWRGVGRGRARRKSSPRPRRWRTCASSTRKAGAQIHLLPSMPPRTSSASAAASAGSDSPAWKREARVRGRGAGSASYRLAIERLCLKSARANASSSRANRIRARVPKHGPSMKWGVACTSAR